MKGFDVRPPEGGICPWALRRGELSVSVERGITSSLVLIKCEDFYSKNLSLINDPLLKSLKYDPLVYQHLRYNFFLGQRFQERCQYL